MNKMDAIVLQALGGVENFYLDRVFIPDPKHGEVRIKIKASSFNPVDFKIRQGKYGECTPLILGADFSGIVDAIGKEVDAFSIGDEVYGMIFGQGSNGSYAQYTCVPYQFVLKKPKHLSFEEASCIPLASLTAYRAVSVIRYLRSKKGSVFIAAAGGVGSFAVQLIQHFHSEDIYTIAGSDETALFLTERLHIKKENIVLYKGLTENELKNRLIALNNGNLFWATFDFVGNFMKTLCVELTGYSGHVVSIVSEDCESAVSTWSSNGSYFQRNLSSHAIFVGAEAYSGKKETWEIYHEHLKHITNLLNEKIITVPFYNLLGTLEPDVVKKAHQLLESGRVRGKLVMLVD
jgi:NADPH2:quinone reductase